MTAAVKAQASTEELTAGLPVSGLISAALCLARAARAAPTKASRAWEACIRLVFEVDPVRYEGCGGELELVAVITGEARSTA